MLTLILGDFSTGKSTAILEMIRRDCDGNIPVKLLVPEQETVVTEGRFTSALPPRAQLTFEVTSFSRLANTAFRTVGGLAAANADKIARSLCMWRALEDVAPKLHRKEKPDKTEIGRYLQAVGELHAHAITPEELQRAALTLEEGNRLRERLEDLELVRSTFAATLRARTGGGEDELDRLYRVLKEHRLFADHRIYADSFTSFTEQEYRILGALCAYTDVTVALCLPAERDGALCYEETEAAYERLLHIAREAGAEVRLEKLTAKPYRRPSARYALSLCRAPQFKTSEPMPRDGGLRLAVAATPFDGADFVASDIRRRAKEEGLRYRDFAVIAGRAQDYAGILDAAMEKADVPYFFSTGTDPEVFEAVKLIHSAYSILRYGWQREDVISYLKCGLCGIEEDKADLFEIYTETWNVSGKLFTRDEPWEMDPAGFSDKKSEESARILRAVNGVREALIPPLLRLQESRGNRPVRLHAEALYRYLEELHVADALLRRAERERAEGRPTEATEYSRLWDILMETLDRLVELLGEDEVSADVFHELFSLALSAQSIGSIPSSVDQVTVGSADLLRIPEARVVYLFDVAEGVFPVKVSDDSYFTDSERKKLSELGLTLAPRLSTDASRALFCFLRAMMKGKEECVFVHLSADESLKPQELSREMKRLKGMGKIPTVTLCALSPLERLYAREPASEMAGALYETPWWEPLRDAIGSGGEYGKLEERMRVPAQNREATLSPATTSRFMKDTFSVSISAMEKYLACPMKYWCNYGLGLKPDQKAVIDTRTVGTYVHYLMEVFFDLCEKKGYDVGTLSEAETEELVEMAAEMGTQKYFPPTVMGQARATHTVERMKETARLLFRDVADEFAQSGFRPICRELHIGGKDGPEKVIFTLKDQTRLAFGGYVDRVDAMEKDGKVYFRVVDYKTGSKTFSPSDIEKGENLQILLYLVAIWKSRSPDFRRRIAMEGDLTPACMEYVSLRTSEEAVDQPLGEEEALALAKERLGRTGLALCDEEVLRAMDKTLSGRFLPVPKDKKGGISLKSKNLFTEDGMEEYLEKVAAHVTGFGEALKSGKIEAKPLPYAPDKPSSSPCKFCDFRDVCRARAHVK